MASELQALEGQIAEDSEADTATEIAKTTAITSTAIVLVEPEKQGLIPQPPKRQRRPSVRLGEIGDQPATLSYEHHVRSTNRIKHPSLRFPKESAKSSKARSLTNLVNGNNNDGHSHHYGPELEEKSQNGDLGLQFGFRKAKAKRGTTKRVRSNWIPHRLNEAEGNCKADGEEEFRDFNWDSESPLKDSTVHSVDNAGMELWHGFSRRAAQATAPEGRENDGDTDNLQETESRDQKCSTSDTVKTWLMELGLSRYTPFFEIHEVDEEVLPLLTLEDLKDMGINAVGPRRKIYAAIQKLSMGLS